MKEQVTDISKVLQDMTEEMRLLRETVNQQDSEIVKLNRNINALNLQIHKKDTELINLRERLAKYENPDKNSNNSSTPPSKERMKDEVIRRTRSLRKPSGKKSFFANCLGIYWNTPTQPCTGVTALQCNFFGD